MKIGLNVTTLSESMDVAAMAQKAEALGFESFTMPEHIVIPVNSKSQYAGYPGSSGDGAIPDFMYNMVDPFIALARASAVTKRIRLGTSICLIPEHNPLLLAKRISTLDHFSGGRFSFGIGTGWLREECELMGGDFDHRWSQAREAVLAMKELWTKEEAEFHGKYYDFPPVRSYPKPAQKPHPPVILGGEASNALKRVAAWGDGWMPSHRTVEQIKTARATLDELAAAAGRDPRSIQVIVFGQQPDPELVKRLEEVGASRVDIRLPPPSGPEVLNDLERIAQRLREHMV